SAGRELLPKISFPARGKRGLSLPSPFPCGSGSRRSLPPPPSHAFSASMRAERPGRSARTPLPEWSGLEEVPQDVGEDAAVDEIRFFRGCVDPYRSGEFARGVACFAAVLHRPRHLTRDVCLPLETGDGVDLLA